MGGEVLELLNDRAERLEREAESRGLERGLKRGLERGLEQGLERGLEQGASDLADLLKELGVGEEVIDEAMSALHEKRAQAASVKEE
jgi:flagellar biosynthesis/type III secretory pathway protein FliH